jgi:hypothetical protein
MPGRSPAAVAAAAIALALAFAAGSGFIASADPAPSPVAATVLLRDRQASVFTLAPPDACAQGAHTADCVQLDTEIEPSIAVNPSNHQNAVAVFQSGRRDSGGDATNGWATTFDGGATWSYGLLPKLTKDTGGPFERASDAVVAFGPDNIVYANSLVFDINVEDAPDPTGEGLTTALRSGMAMNVSRDGGRTWGDPIIFQDDLGGGFIDKNWIVVDTSDAPGHHKGRVYCVWDRVAPVVAVYSDDEGKTWQGGSIDGLGAGSGTPPVASGGVGYLVYPGQGIGSLPLVMPNGDLAVIFATDAAPAPVAHPMPGDDIAEAMAGVSKFEISTASGAGSLPTGSPLVFGPAVSAGVYNGNSIRQQRAGNGIHTAAVDPNDGSIYIAWNDARYRTDAANDVVITRSTDGGLTWSAPKRVNPGAANDQLDHYDPMLAVGDDGSVRMAYRRRQEAATPKADGSSFSQQIDTYYTVSYDKGDTWSAPLKVNTPVANAHYAAQSRGGAFLGDYEQIAAAGKNTYIVRMEPVRVGAEPQTFPPRYHHQRTWVAVVGPATPGGFKAPRKPARVLANRASRGGAALPSTGLADASWLVFSLLAGSLLMRRTLRSR